MPGDGGRPQPHLCGAVRPPRLPRASVNNLQTRHPWLFQNTELCKVTRARAHIPTHAPAHMHPLPGPGQGGRRTPGVLCRAEPERTADPVFACARSAWGASRMSRMREQSPWDGRGRVARRPGSTTCSPKGLGVRRRHLCSAWGSCSCRLTRCPPDLAEATRCIYHYTSPTYSRNFPWAGHSGTQRGQRTGQDRHGLRQIRQRRCRRKGTHRNFRSYWQGGRGGERMTEWPAVVSQAGPAQRGGLGLARPRVRSRARPCGHSLARVPGPETRACEAAGCPRAGCLRRREGRAAELRLRDELGGRVDVPFGAPGPRGLGEGRKPRRVPQRVRGAVSASSTALWLGAVWGS